MSDLTHTHAGSPWLVECADSAQHPEPSVQKVCRSVTARHPPRTAWCAKSAQSPPGRSPELELASLGLCPGLVGSKPARSRATWTTPGSAPPILVPSWPARAVLVRRVPFAGGMPLFLESFGLAGSRRQPVNPAQKSAPKTASSSQASRSKHSVPSEGL